MTRHLLVLAAVTLCSCDPFVYEVDVPRFCAIASHVPFAGDGSSAHAALPLELGLKDRLSQPGQMGEVELLSVQVEADQELGAVHAAQLTVEPAPQLGSTLGTVQIRAATTPDAQGTTLSIPGQAADLFMPLKDGPATLGITLEGVSAARFTAQVTSCVHVRLAKRYLER